VPGYDRFVPPRLKAERRSGFSNSLLALRFHNSQPQTHDSFEAQGVELPMGDIRREPPVGTFLGRHTSHEQNRDSPLVSAKAAPLRNGQATVNSSFFEHGSFKCTDKFRSVKANLW
jgi:hypothetical protein